MFPITLFSILAAAAVVLLLWNLVLIVYKWKRMAEWTKALHLILLFSGVGPVVSIILLHLNVGIHVD
jgi:hypothetical protein